MLLGVSLEAITGRAAEFSPTPQALDILLDRIVTTVRTAGFQVVEVPMDASRLYPGMFTPQVFRLAAARALADNLLFSVHLPHADIDLTSLDEELRRASVARIVEAIDLANLLNPISYVLHLATEQHGAGADFYPRVGRGALPAETLEQADRSLGEIARSLDPARLCVENLRGAPFEQQVPLAVSHNAALCIDVGHFLVQEADPVQAIGRWGHLAKEIHLHDVVRAPTEGAQHALEDHQALGTGILQLPALIAALKERRFDGLLTLELFDPARLQPSISALRAVL